MFLKKKYKQFAGFTLVELLVTLSIISLLLAILFPSLSLARKAARKIFCANHMQQIGTAIFSYAQKNDQQVIKAGEMMYSHSASEAMSFWYVKLLPYVGQKSDMKNIFNNTTEIWICPEDKDAYPRGFLNCPHTPLTSYAPNGYYPQRNADVDKSNLKLGPAGGYKLSQIGSASQCMLMGETSYSAQFYDADAPSVASDDLPRDGHHRCTSGFYHNGFMNILFVDGHLEAVRGRQTSELIWPVGVEEPHKNGQYMYWPDLELSGAKEKPEFWGPGY